MTQPPDREEQQLQALFDATAPEPDAQQLRRLARYAATVPDEQPANWRARLRWWMPAVGLAAVALLGGLLWWSQRVAPGGEGVPLASAPPQLSAPVVSHGAASIEQWEPADDEEAWALLEVSPALLASAPLDGEDALVPLDANADVPELEGGLAALGLLSFSAGADEHLDALDAALDRLLEDG